MQAFELAAVPALEAPNSLVVPPGWFRPQRVVEVLERGSDFERLAYEAVPA